jgi:hypothetical protein
MLSWFNWHEPLITPATAFYCVVGWLAIEALIWIARRVIAEGKAERPDAFDEPHGDVPHTGGRS